MTNENILYMILNNTFEDCFKPFFYYQYPIVIILEISGSNNESCDAVPTPKAYSKKMLGSKHSTGYGVKVRNVS